MRLHLKETLNFPLEILYETVANVEEYPHFLPWCRQVRIIERLPNIIVADLVIGYGFFQETYRSKVHLEKPYKIDVEYVRGPFKALQNYWRFKEINTTQTEVEFFIEVEFKSKFLQKIMEKAFAPGADHLISAFKRRLEGS